jgi:hypothetical protein
MGGKTAMARIGVTVLFQLFASFLLAFFQQIPGIGSGLFRGCGSFRFSRAGEMPMMNGKEASGFRVRKLGCLRGEAAR